jgi:hypothetical protein
MFHHSFRVSGWQQEPIYRLILGRAFAFDGRSQKNKTAQTIGSSPVFCHLPHLVKLRLPLVF